MPLPADTVSLSVGGLAHANWVSYDIDSDLLTPADAWTMQLGGGQAIPESVQPGADVVIRIGGETVLVGVVDEVSEQADKHAHSVRLSGRDLAGQLLDCSAPVFNELHVSLERILTAICKPFGIPPAQIKADKTQTRRKVSTTPGQTAWEVIQNAAEANGLWPWFDPSGTLILGRPDVATPVVDTLVLSRTHPERNNVLSATYTRSLHEVYSEVRVLGQAAGGEGERSMRGIWGKATAVNPIRARLKISTDYDAENSKIAEARAKKELADGLLKAKCVTCTVRGHRTAGGSLWTPGQRVALDLKALGVSGVWLLMARKFRLGRDAGTLTELTLYPDGLWQVDAHPHERVQRKAKLAAKSGDKSQ